MPFNYFNPNHLIVGNLFTENGYGKVYLVVKINDPIIYGRQIGFLTLNGIVYNFELGDKIEFFGMGSVYGPSLSKVNQRL